MIPLLVHKIEGGYPRDGGAEEEEEGQGWGDSRRLMKAGSDFSLSKSDMGAFPLTNSLVLDSPVHESN